MMTPMEMDRVLGELATLAKANRVPDDIKLTYRVKQLESMRRYYQEKLPDVPEKLGYTFTGFISALDFAISTIDAYRKLATEVGKLANGGKEAKDGEN